MPSENALAWLYVHFPDDREETIPLTQTSFTIGRKPDSDLVLPDKTVSSRHARLLFEDERIHLIDLGSSNGTFVKGDKLTPNRPYALSQGGEFRIGPYVLRLETSPRPSEPKRPPLARMEAIAAPPPPPPHEPAAPAADGGRPSYEAAFGLPAEHSRYLRYLPPIYDEHPFLGRFLLAFEGVLAPIEQTVDNFDLYLRPRSTPAFFLEQLAAWLGLALDEKWPLEKRRAIVAEAAELYRRRGTRWGLIRHLEIYTEVTPEIVEPEGHPHHFEVILRIPPGHQKVDRVGVERIINANRPAHTTYTLRIVEAKG